MPEKDLIFSQLKETNKTERTLYMTYDENTSSHKVEIMLSHEAPDSFPT